MEFVGLENYETILTNGDKATYASYWSTIVYSLNVPICIALALYIAYLLNNAKFGQRFFRSVFFIPYVCAAVVVALAFKTIYHRESGVLNAILSFLGFAPVSWLNESPWTFMASTIILTVWQGLGFCILLFQAALANVDTKLYEAAKLDGATNAQIFWKITWPAISPTTSYLVTMKIIWALQAMTETYILTNGPNPVVPTWGEMGNGAWVSDLVVKHIYNMVWVRPAQAGYGMAAAAGWILAIIVFIITKLNMKAQERWVSYDF
jgi:multiple sugar transport system permease protein